MITTDEVARRMTNPEHTILDVRPMAAYNGWSLREEARGGHVPGARSIPLEWTRYMDWVEVVEEKSLDPEGPVTVYGYTAESGEEMAHHLARLGFRRVEVYGDFLSEWSPDPERPLRRLDRYRDLVHPEWLQALMDGEGTAELEKPRWVLCHTHFGNPEDYHTGHIPGAIPLDTNRLEDPETWNRRAPDELAEALRSLGIRHDSTVILYGRHSHPTYEEEPPGKRAGHLAAMRCALILLYAGVRDVRVLNGGIHSWTAAGHQLSSREVTPDPVEDFGAEVPGRPEYVVDLPEARALLESDDGELVSIRSWEEFVGERSGYHYIEKKGRIPGAVFGNCGSDAYHMENYRNFDYTTREFSEIARNWAEVGVTPRKRVAFYCGTGWRGSEAFMNAYFMGWPHVAVYDGGWFEWSGDPSNPVATGSPHPAPTQTSH